MSRACPVAVVIPAYEPGPALVELARALQAAGLPVVVVDDGSTCACDVFDAVAGYAQLVRLPRNHGKGGALRAGIRQALTCFPEAAGIVTADADGQHSPEDILRVAHLLSNDPLTPVLGAREFDASVPRRSRLGNAVSQFLVRLLVGVRFADTQTGLRGLPRAFANELLALDSPGYEFELDMLIAARHSGLRWREIPIRTLYFDGNSSSHFKPVRDSLRIGLVLLRFALLALLTSAVDNAIFAAVLATGAAPALAQIAARLCAMCLNYPLARRAVFLSRQPHRQTLPRYLAVVALSGLASYALLHFIAARSGLAVPVAKVAAEALLFALNFLLLRDLVFTRRVGSNATDWDAYYERPFAAARFTRRYTATVLGSVLRRHAPASAGLTVVEFGGANSCFLETISAIPGVARYRAADTNSHGLSLLPTRAARGCPVEAIEADVLNPEPALGQADIVLSVGLIEHFTPDGTRRAIENHFRACRDGGLVVLSYPTPTFLYRAVRFLAEAVRAWRFPDERPLDAEEVHAEATRHGALVFDKVLWPLLLTQRMMAFRK